LRRFRLRTLLLWVALAGLVAALAVQQRRMAQHEVALQAAFAENRQMFARTRQLTAQNRQLMIMLTSAHGVSETELEQATRVFGPARSKPGAIATLIKGWSTPEERDNSDRYCRPSPLSGDGL
jgi:hypothetical protein